MKKAIFFITTLILLFCSCQNKTIELPVEKMYIVECSYNNPIDTILAMRVFGFSELNKNFNLKYVQHIDSDFQYHYTSTIDVADSLKNKISNIIEKYPTDTTFLYKGKSNTRLYHGNLYLFILKKNKNVNTRIYFEPRFLPDDLLFLYKYLYDDRQPEYKGKDTYTDLFKEFDSIYMEGAKFKLPVLRKTIEFTFTPPILIKQK